MPRYSRSVLVAPGDVRRVREAAELTQAELAARLELDVRTVERWERAGAVLELVSKLLAGQYNATRLGRLELVANRAGLELELVDVGLGRGKRVARVKRPRARHFVRDRENRSRKTRQATRSGRGAVRRHG